MEFIYVPLLIQHKNVASDINVLVHAKPQAVNEAKNRC
jgi:hypothetical protein